MPSTFLDPSARPLQGITVLDLSRVLAGPFCTMILAQLGARVLKVERPGSGDDSRAFGPFVNGKSLYFSSINYDKQSVTLNLKLPADRAIFEDLLGISDVVVENLHDGEARLRLRCCCTPNTRI
jgi:CoA:oxalate CoA-transferase